MRAGFQPCVHAIGDRANRIVLDAFEAALRSAPSADVRPRVEHAQVLAPEDIPRFAALHVIASMQPTHATSDMPWAEARVGAERLRGAYAWRTLSTSGAMLAFGSDFPVERPEPLEGLYAAVARADRDGKTGRRMARRGAPRLPRRIARLHLGRGLRRFRREPARPHSPPASMPTSPSSAPTQDRWRAEQPEPSRALLGARIVMTVVAGKKTSRSGVDSGAPRVPDQGARQAGPTLCASIQCCWPSGMAQR